MGTTRNVVNAPKTPSQFGDFRSKSTGIVGTNRDICNHSHGDDPIQGMRSPGFENCKIPGFELCSFVVLVCVPWQVRRTRHASSPTVDPLAASMGPARG
eukprot:6951572-Karenia_brevis.AAC.1